MISRVLPLLLVTALACAMVNVKPGTANKTGKYSLAYQPGGHARIERTSSYWKLERRYVAALKREGRLGAEVRRLRRHEQARTLQAAHSTEATIRLVFASHGDEAVRVSSCETGGTFSTSATNGQYLGLFQMGDYARSTYGHGPTVLEQALAAYRYFVASGYSWGPWECKP